MAFADSSKPSLDLISAPGCVEFGDRQAVCAPMMGQHGVCKGGCSSVHRRSRYKSLISDRKQRSLSLGESFMTQSESSSYILNFLINAEFDGSFTLVLGSFFCGGYGQWYQVAPISHFTCVLMTALDRLAT